jgi:hypothetical protein
MKIISPVLHGKCHAAPVAALSGNFKQNIFRGNLLYPAGNFCHPIYRNAIYSTYCLQKRFASRDCLVPRLKFITLYGTIRSLKSTYAGSSISDLQWKFLFLKKNIFSRPDFLTLITAG